MQTYKDVSMERYSPFEKQIKPTEKNTDALLKEIETLQKSDIKTIIQKCASGELQTLMQTIQGAVEGEIQSLLDSTGLTFSQLYQILSDPTHFSKNQQHQLKLIIDQMIALQVSPTTSLDSLDQPGSTATPQANERVTKRILPLHEQEGDSETIRLLKRTRRHWLPVD
jgi:hypothetical protein